MSRYELAKRIGVTYPTITAIYNSEVSSVKFDTLESICLELNCTPNDILCFSNKTEDADDDIPHVLAASSGEIE